MNMRNCLVGAAALAVVASGLYAFGGSAALFPLVLLACPLMMMVMMAGMNRTGGREEKPSNPTDVEVPQDRDHAGS